MRRENGRCYFYQWELDQRIIVPDNCTMVHFENGTQEKALPSEVFEENGVRLAKVPNILLQTAAELNAYAWDDQSTSVIEHVAFNVFAREKPDDYAYTETEVYSIQTVVENALREAKEKGTFDGRDGVDGKDGADGKDGKDGADGKDGTDGKTPVKGLDYHTDDDKAELVDAVLVAIAERHCPEFTESGAVVNCEPVEGYPLAVVSSITPVQNGTPSPQAPCPITGYTVANLRLGGENLANAKSIKNGYSDTSVEVSDDGYTIVSVGGSKAWAAADIEIDITGLAGKTVYLKADAIEYTQTYPSGVLPIAYTTDGTVYLLAIQSSRLQSAFTIPENTTRFVLRISTNNTGETHDADNTLTVKGLMLTLTDYADWEPFRESVVYTAQLGQEVYGGTFNWDTGVLTVKYVYLELTGKEGWTSEGNISGEIYRYYTRPKIAGYHNLIQMCSHYPRLNSYSSPTEHYYINGNVAYFFSAIPTGAEWMAYLAEQAANGTPVQLCYEMTEPYTVQLDPQQIIALPGVNTLYSDTGDTTVTGKMAPAVVFARMEERIAALEAALVNT